MRLFEAIIEGNHRAIAGGQSAIGYHHVSQPVTNCYQLKAEGIELVTNCNRLKTTAAAEQAELKT